jgi:hypothetical protein
VKDNEPKEMSRPEVTTIVICVAIALCVAPALYTACPEWLQKNGGSCSNWYTFIKDFQTLISGIFAIAAAYIAVYQMRDSDTQASLRHMELVEIETRPAKLMIEKAVRQLRPSLSRLIMAADQDLSTADAGLDRVWDQEQIGYYTTGMTSVCSFFRTATLASVSDAKKELSAEIEEKLNDCVSRAEMVLPTPVTRGDEYFDWLPFFDAINELTEDGFPKEHDVFREAALSDLRYRALELLKLLNRTSPPTPVVPRQDVIFTSEDQ